MMSLSQSDEELLSSSSEYDDSKEEEEYDLTKAEEVLGRVVVDDIPRRALILERPTVRLFLRDWPIGCSWKETTAVAVACLEAVVPRNSGVLAELELGLARWTSGTSSKRCKEVVGLDVKLLVLESAIDVCKDSLEGRLLSSISIEPPSCEVGSGTAGSFVGCGKTNIGLDVGSGSGMGVR